MNANCYKIIFSKHLGTWVAVGEHTTSTGKAASGQACRSVVHPTSFGAAMVDGFDGVLRLAFASVALACVTLSATQAQSNLGVVAATALPQGGSVNTGNANISTQGANMAIAQTTDKASINWQSFNVGTDASVNITQPSASSVLLNRVVGNDPSQILGKLSANGQLILLNPNGIVFGKDGSVAASSFTASTFGLNDADFMDGFYKYSRNGSTAAVVNQGTIETSAGGFVALIGATVTNEGTIRAPQGDVMLVAAETVTLPASVGNNGTSNSNNTVSVRMSKRVRLELDPAAINTAVNNTDSGVIVTEGGQVLLQAAALSTAVASVTHSGRIDTSAPEAGAVTVLADNGVIKVDGSIIANSSGTDGQGQARKGANIIIGRDEATGVLAHFADVSGAKLESNQGFVETSGDVLSTTGTRVKAGEWLLDPYNITIAAGPATTPTTPDYSNYTSGADSTILASDISANLTAGTSVTIATGAGGSSVGNIAVNESIAKTGGGDASLTLLAHGNITIASNKTITSNTGKLNVLLNSDSDASGSGNILFNSGSGVTSNGGNITLGGGSALNGSGSAIGDGVSSYAGINLGTATFNAGGGNIAMTGTTFRNAPTNSPNVHGILITGGSISTTGSGTIALKGYSNTITATLSKAIQTTGATITGGSTGTISLIGDSRSATALGDYLYGVSLGTSTVVTSLGGNIEVTGYGGNSSGNNRGNIGVALSSAKVVGVGTGTVTISGTGGQGNSGTNIGFWTNGASTAVSSQGADINITGQGGNGANSEGIVLGGGTVGVATGITSANVILTTDSVQLQSSTINSGTGTTTIKNRTAGTLINVGGADVLNTTPLTLGITNAEMNLITAGTLKIGSTSSGAVTTSAAVTTAASTGNLYMQSGSSLAASHAIASGAGLYLQTNGGALSNSAALSGQNVSLDNSNGSINLATGAITSGAGITAASDGVTVSGALTATTNLNIYGASGSANGVNTSANWSGQYINAIGTTNTGFTGFSWNGGTINTTGIGGTSTASTLKGISAASSTASNGHGALMMFANGAVNSATGTALTLAGEATTLTTGQNTKQRGILVQGGRTITMSGDVTLDGSSKSSEGISFGGTINMATVAGVTNKLTIKGTSAASSNASLNALNFSGAINGNAATSSINLIGEAKNLTGTSYDNAVNTTGTITGSSANVNIQALYGKMSLDSAITGANISVDNTGGTIDASTGVITAGAGTSLYTNAVNINKALTATGNINVLGRVATTTTTTGVNLTATAPITSSGNAKTINIDSNGNIANAAAFTHTGSTGTGANINITSTSGKITGAGAMGDTTNKNAGVTFTQAGTSSYSGVINAANFTKAGAGTVALTGDSSAFEGTTTVSGGTLQVGDGGVTGILGTANAVTLLNNSTFAFNRAANTTIDQNITGNGHVTANITGDLALTNNIALTGTNTINLTASGSITETAGSLAATNLYMTTTNGGIGAVGNRIQSNVTNLSFSSGGDVFVTEATGVNVSGRTTANNGNIDVATTLGTLTVNSVNSINGITANGTGNISLSGNAATGHGLSINNVVTATNGNVSLTGTTASTTFPNAGVYSQNTVTAQNITMVAESTSTSGTVLGYYGAYGVFNASQALSLTGISRSSGNGLYTYGGSYLSGTGMTVVGSSAAGQGIGFERSVTVTNSTSGGISMTGTATDSRQQAIGFQGVAITNGGGALTITANNGLIHSSIGGGTNTITNSGTGAVQITAGNGSPTNSGSIDGSVLTIIQNGNAGVVVSTSGTGNVTSPKIINAGTGDIVVAAGSTLAAGDGTGGQILTVANNTLTQTNAAPGKTYVYSGAAASTGVLSNLSTGFTSLYYQGTSQALNAGFSQGFDANHANDMSVPGGGTASNTQVFFRSATKPAFSMTLANTNKVYGDADPTLSTTNAATLTNAFAGVGGNNTFAITTADVLDGLTGTRAAGQNVGTYAYNLDASSFNTTLTAQPNLVIAKRDITLSTIVANNKTYDGFDSASISSATFGNIANGEILSLSGLGTFSDKNAANGKTVTFSDVATLIKVNGTGAWSNYNLTTTGATTTTANIAKASLTAKANADARFVTQADAVGFNGVSYSGFMGGDTAAVVDATGLSISRTNDLNDIAAGTYTGVLVPTGLSASNYTMAYTNGNYTIVPADRLLVRTTNQSVTYGSTPTYSTTAQYLDSQSNQIKALTQTGTNNNYTFNDGSGTTVSLALKPYRGANTAAKSTSGNTVVGNFDVKDAAYTQTGSNFNGTPVFIGTLTVDPKAITLSTNDISKTYDGNTSVTGATVTASNKALGDIVNATASTGSYASKEVGSGIAVTLSNLSLTGDDASNYYLSANTLNTTGAITAASNSGMNNSGTNNSSTSNSGTSNSSSSSNVNPPKPIIPNDSDNSSEDGNGSGGGRSAQNPYLVLPNNNANTADNCTASNLEACVCEEQDPTLVPKIAICYQPKKTASTQASRPRS